MNPCSPGLARPTGLRAWATGLGFLHCLDCLVLQLVSAGWRCCPATSSTAGTGQKDLNHQLMLPFSSCSPESGYCCPGLGNYGDVSCDVRPGRFQRCSGPQPARPPVMEPPAPPRAPHRALPPRAREALRATGTAQSVPVQE
ncbi:hypothetical protein ACCO45_013023 [Purpureocillium lilacinum]|uniref:Uncharacterized protein n=1 Tax=Purpureocillium lilacinum TaxID=33203 RepID=A0ACC4D9N3_PURLI